MKLALRKSDSMEDWYLIERAEHGGAMEMRRCEDGHGYYLWCESRISNADVEGGFDEMRAIANAIRDRSEVGFERCAVRVEGDRVFFCSPRNSTEDGECSLAEADDLAAQIEAEVAK